MGPTLWDVARYAGALAASYVVGLALGGWAAAVDCWARRGRS